LYEVNEASTLITEAAHEDAEIIFGAVIDETLTDEVKVTVIATGFDQRQPTPKPKTVFASGSLPPASSLSSTPAPAVSQPTYTPPPSNYHQAPPSRPAQVTPPPVEAAPV
jgi:cell division protein FtsZ